MKKTTLFKQYLRAPEMLGLSWSPDKMLQARIFAYADTLLVQFAVIWVLVFGLLAVLLSFAPSTSASWIGADAARGATLVDAAMLVLVAILPPLPPD